MDETINQENKYAAELQQAHAENLVRQRGNEQQRRLQTLSGSPTATRPETHKISPMQAFLLIGAAFVVDVLSALFIATVVLSPLSWILWAFATLSFLLWFHMLGISWTDAKGLRSFASLGGGSFIEFVPGLNAIVPAWTAFAIIAIINDRVGRVAGAVVNKKSSTS